MSQPVCANCKKPGVHFCSSSKWSIEKDDWEVFEVEFYCTTCGVYSYEEPIDSEDEAQDTAKNT